MVWGASERSREEEQRICIPLCGNKDDILNVLTTLSIIPNFSYFRHIAMSITTTNGDCTPTHKEKTTNDGQ